MFKFLRKYATGPFGLVLIILLVFAFSIWGVGDIFRGYDAGKLASVGNKDITIQEFQFRFNREINRISNELQRFISTEEARESGLDIQVLNRLIIESSITEVGNNMRLRPSDKTIAKRIGNTKAFRNAFNEFDRNIFNQVIRQNGLTEEMFLETERESIIQKQIFDSIFGNFKTPETMNKLLYQFQYESRSIDYVLISLSSEEEVSIISDLEIDSYFNKNKNSYAEEQRRDFTILALLNIEINEKIVIDEDEAYKLFQENQSLYEIPQKRSYYLIPFIDSDQLEKAQEDYLYDNDLEKLLNARGLNKSDVDQGLISIKKGLSFEISQMAFNAEINELVGPVNSPFGPSLIYVTKITEEEKRDFSDVKNKIIKDLKESASQDKIYELYNLVEDERASGKTFEEIAIDQNLELKAFNSVTSNGKNLNDQYLDMPALEEILEKVFDSEIGTEIDSIEDNVGNIIFVRVDDIRDANIPSLNEVREEVINDLRINKNKELTELKATQYLNKISEQSIKLEEIADELEVAILNSGNIIRSTTNEVFSRASILKVFETKKDSTFVAPVAIGNSMIVGVVKSISTLEENEERMNSLKEVNEPRFENELIFSLSQELQKELTTEVYFNRLINFFEPQNAQGSF